MARRFDVVVFDWDGTLLDSAGAIVACIQAACRDLGVEPPQDHVARQVIGLGLGDALAIALPQLPPSEYGRLAQRYRHHYLGQDEALRLFDGVLDLVRKLHAAGVMLGVATGKSRRGLDRALALTGMAEFFQVTRCADETLPKPDPTMLVEILECFAVPADRALMIGDTTHDMKMARGAGVDALAVSFGAHPEEALLAEEPLACFASVSELDAWITRNI